MQLDNETIKNIVIAGSYVAAEDIEAAEKDAEKHNTTIVDLAAYLVSHDLITKDLLGQAIAESLSVPYTDLNSNPPAKEQVLTVPEEVAKTYNVVLLAQTDTGITIATDDPKNEALLPALAEIFPGAEVAVTYSLTEDILRSMVHYQKPLETRFSKILEEDGAIAPELLGEIFSDAYTFHASDIHFEPQADVVVIRFRVDGILREAGRIPKEYYENILNRIKIQSRLRIDEHFAAQDGSMQYKGDDGVFFDLRTSIIPTVEGEKVVLRVLAAYIGTLSLGNLGLNTRHQEILERAAAKPFGMILVTGPTGSGKTTTLYALLRILNDPEVNITTIEDPVEYKMVGVNQIQVNAQTNLTFAKGLRSIVRQDPDIILVGEIRDSETAETAVNAALTGHLLLSTFHANNAATAIPRLLDMEIEPFLLASTLEVVIAQRLARKICDTCKYSQKYTTAELKEKYGSIHKEFKGKTITLYAGKGCDACNHSGYRGRTALFEFIQITPELQDLILTNPSTAEIWTLAKKQGAISLCEDGIEKVKSGMITLEELARVAPPQAE